MATKKLTVEQFTLQAITNLRNPQKSNGIHVVYSGFNQAFREYFPKKDLKKELQRLVDAGKIVMVPRKGGPMIYLPDEGPADASAEGALRRILGQDQDS
jgi:hypothetical protein